MKKLIDMLKTEHAGAYVASWILHLNNCILTGALGGLLASKVLPFSYFINIVIMIIIILIACLGSLYLLNKGYYDRSLDWIEGRNLTETFMTWLKK